MNVHRVVARAYHPAAELAVEIKFKDVGTDATPLVYCTHRRGWVYCCFLFGTKGLLCPEGGVERAIVCCFEAHG